MTDISDVLSDLSKSSGKLDKKWVETIHALDKHSAEIADELKRKEH